MTTEPPIACTLTEAETPARRHEIAAIARDLVCADAQESRAVLRFRAAAGTRERVAPSSRPEPLLRVPGMELREDPTR